jgi:PAS domain-containing protein
VNIARVMTEDEQHTHILAIAFDISNEVAVRKEQQQLLSLVENSNDLIMVSTLEGHLTYLNEEGIRLLGLPNKKAAITKSLKDFCDATGAIAVQEEIIPTLLKEGNGQAGSIMYTRIRVRYYLFIPMPSGWIAP